MKQLLTIAAGLLGAATAMAQSGRVMVLRAPANAGQTADFEMTYPAAAAGNLYSFVWSAPFPFAVPVSLPGYAVQGLARVNSTAAYSLFAGVLGASGSVRHTWSVPNNPAYFGFTFDLQGLDLSAATSSLSIADNDLAPIVRPAQQWQAPTLVDGGVNPEVQMGVSRSGSAFVFWYDASGNTQVRRYTPATGWGAVANFVSGPAGSLRVAVDDNGNAIAVWTDSVSDVNASRYTVGIGWSAPVVIDNGPGYAFEPRIAIDRAGNGIAVWSQHAGPWNNGISSMQACHFTAASGWGGPVTIENDTLGDTGEADIAIDDAGNATVVWGWSAPNGPGYSYDVWGNRFTVGTGWGNAGPIGNLSANNPDPRPRVAMDGNGRAIAVWVDDVGGYRKVWSSRHAGSWSAPVRLDPASVNRSVEPRVAMDPVGNAIAVWCENDGVRDNLVACRYDIGSGWGSGALIENNNSGPVSEPRLVMDYNGYATAVWLHRNPGAYTTDVWANRFVPGTGFGTAAPISGPPIAASDVKLGIDGSGNLVTVWSQQAAVGYDLAGTVFR